MKTYEALIIYPSGGELPQDGKNLFEDAVRKHEGKVLNRTELGKRLLGYSVKRAKEGYFASVVFELSPEKMDQFKRALQLMDGILKFTIIHKRKIELARPQLYPKPSSYRTAPSGEKREAHYGS